MQHPRPVRVFWFVRDNDYYDAADNDHDCTNDYDYNLLLLRPVDRRELRHRRLCEHSDISDQRVFAVWLRFPEQVRELRLVHNDYHIDADHDHHDTMHMHSVDQHLVRRRRLR